MIARLCFILLRKEINFEPGFRSGESAIGHSPTPSSAASLRENRNVRLCKSALFAFQKTGRSALLLHKRETIVFYALSWSVMFILLALWSLAAWAFHLIAAWTVSNAGVLAGGSGAIDGLRAPDWLAPWIPPELALAFTSMLSALGPAIETALNQAPALADGLSVAAWAVWGVGSALIIILGLVCSRLITVLRRRQSAFAAPRMGPAAAD